MFTPPKMDRRGFGLGLAALAGSAVVPRSARAAGQSVLILGGSAIVGALGIAIETKMKERGFETHRKAKSSSGLARPDFYDWVEQGRALYAQHRPALTVVLYGGNDCQGLWMGKKASPPWIRWQEEGWSEEYRRRVIEVTRAVSPKGEKVAWLGMPMVRPEKLRRRLDRLNGIFRDAMAACPNGQYIDLWSVLSDGKGGYAELKTVDGKRRRMRAEDGIHLTRTGAIVLADHICPQLAQVLGSA